MFVVDRRVGKEMRVHSRVTLRERNGGELDMLRGEDSGSKNRRQRLCRRE